MPRINYHRVKKVIARFQRASGATKWVELYINRDPDPCDPEGEDICLFFNDERTAARFAEAINSAFYAASVAPDTTELETEQRMP